MLAEVYFTKILYPQNILAIRYILHAYILVACMTTPIHTCCMHTDYMHTYYMHTYFMRTYFMHTYFFACMTTHNVKTGKVIRKINAYLVVLINLKVFQGVNH